MSDPLETNVAINLPKSLDFLGVSARVDSIATLLQGAQEQKQELEHVRVLNNRELDDHIDVPDKREEAPTYRERIDALNEGISSLLLANEDIYEELMVEAASRRKQVERRIEKAGQDD